MLQVELQNIRQKHDQDLVMPSMPSKKWQPIKEYSLAVSDNPQSKHKEHSSSNVKEDEKLLSVDNEQK